MEAIPPENITWEDISNIMMKIEPPGKLGSLYLSSYLYGRENLIDSSAEHISHDDWKSFSYHNIPLDSQFIITWLTHLFVDVYQQYSPLNNTMIISAMTMYNNLIKIIRSIPVSLHPLYPVLNGTASRESFAKKVLTMLSGDRGMVVVDLRLPAISR